MSLFLTNTSSVGRCVFGYYQDYFSSSDARQSQTAQIQAEMERTKGVMHETIGAICITSCLLQPPTRGPLARQPVMTVPCVLGMACPSAPSLSS
jgi:hypothetical protein